METYLKSILFNELVKVHREQLEGHAHVISEAETLQHVHKIHVVITILKMGSKYYGRR